MPDVNPDILKWARETAGYSPAEAARLLGISDARGQTGEERLEALELGTVQPTRPLLQKMSQKYRRSLLIFYLSAPPPKGDRGQDFRKLPSSHTTTYDANVDALIREIQTRQDLVRSLLEDEESAILPFVGSVDQSIGSTALSKQISEALSFRLEEFRGQRTIDQAFSYLRNKIEAAGVFVILAGNLGSHHSNISVDVFRGFAIADKLAPFIVINDQDTHSAWSFTALHELVHIWLGTTGVSGSIADSQIEKFCNDVAGRILIPDSDLSSLADIRSLEFADVIQMISSFAQERHVSRSMVAYKLFLSNMITEELWGGISRRLRQDWLDNKASKGKGDLNSLGGPSYYVVKRHRLGAALLNLVQRSLGDGSITPTKAGRVLGVKPRNVGPLLQSSSTQRGL